MLVLLLVQLIDLYTIVIFAAVVLSWIQLSPGNPVAQFVYSLTEPVLAPARRILPPMGSLDLSPILVLVVLRVIRSVLIQSV